MSTIANMYRDEKRHPQPYQPSDFFDSLKEEEKDIKMSPNTIKNILQTYYPPQGN